MSIYTITLKRELLSSSPDSCGVGAGSRGQADWLRQGEATAPLGAASSLGAGALAPFAASALTAAASASSAAADGASDAANACDTRNGSNLGAKQAIGGEGGRETSPPNSAASIGGADRPDCLRGQEAEEAEKSDHPHLSARERQLQEQANLIEHSVNVTLEVTANLKQPNRIVWFKNNRQLTSSDQPILFVRQQRRTTRTTSITKSTGVDSSRTTEEKSSSREEEEESCLVRKCVQESSERGSKLTIHDIQDDDYGQYTCKLIGPDGSQLDIQTQLKLDDSEESEKFNQEKRNLIKRRSYKFGTEMDELIEVKEGDLDIELGIQILPETQDDEELMSEEEKRDFIDGTTITWFKDDQKLSASDPEVLKLFQFTFDQNEGFHKLIVKRATKETEGVYTCLVENESGTSSCSTQLVVGPGNKPKLTSRLQDVTVYVGQSLEFRIKSTGLPPIDSCQWFRDDRLLIEMANESSSREVRSKTNERVSMSRSEEIMEDGERMIIFKLAIENLKLDDTGRYKCRIINEHGHDETDCQVKVLQEIIEEHEEIEETIEETMRLGGGKKSTREEVVEEEEEEERKEEVQQVQKRQRQELDEQMGSAPRFVRELEDQEFGFGHEEELLVSTERDEWCDSREQLKIRWFYEGREVTSSSSEHRIENFYEKSRDQWLHRLFIKSSRSVGSYTCKASNEFGECETSCQVRSRRRRSSALLASSQRKPRFLRELEDTETYVGETIVMRVALDDGDELDDLRFLKDGKLIYSSRRDGQESRELHCGQLERSRLRIRTRTETIEEESTVTSSYSTRRGSRLALTGTRARVFELEVEEVQVDSMGGWQCEAENSAGSVSCKAEVEVFAEPKLVTDLEEKVRVKPGSEIRLTVEASGSPRPVYSWFKDSEGIAEEEERVFTQTTTSTKTTTTTKTRRSSVSSMRAEDGVSISGETLIIKDARPEDAGAYTCIIENRLGQVRSRKCSLTVIGHGDDLHSKPRIIKDFSRDQLYELEEGESVTLRVLAEGHPRPQQRWFRDTEEIVEREQRFEMENEGQEYQLKIRRSQASDSGKYKVVLKNELGETESRQVEVRVSKLSEEVVGQRRPSAPTIQLDSQDKVVGLGSTISFDVQVGGHPKPFITWYKNGRRLTESPDGRVSFVEEETVTTIVEEEETTGRRKSRKESSTIHRLVIRDVRESDEAIYSLKAENELGQAKSALVSLTIDKRKESVDELKERREKRQQVEETTTTEVTTTTQVTREDREDAVEEEEEEESLERRRRRTVREQEEDLDEELDDAGRQKKKTTRTTRTTTTTTTTSTQEEEEEDEEERRRRQRRLEEEQEEEEESRKSAKQRRVLVEEEEEEEVEEETRQRRERRLQQEEQQVITNEEEEETSQLKTRVVQMEVDEEVERSREEAREETVTSRRRDERRETVRKDEEEEEEEEEIVVKSKKPRIKTAPKKVLAGLGSSPELEVEVETTVVVEEEEETKVTWLKDGQPIPARLLRDSHVELLEKHGDQPNTKKHILRINSLRSSDAAKYKLVAENQHGKVETEDIELEVDRTMRPGQRPSITPADVQPERPEKAPRIKSVPEEVVAGVGSKPRIEAEVEGNPEPKLSWFKDGQPLEEQPEFKSGHLEVVDLPSEKPDVKKQALQINGLKPADAAAYHVKAENPLGDDESEPTNLRIDRSMGPRDEPVVTKDQEVPMEVDAPAAVEPKKIASPKLPRLPVEERVLEAPEGAQATIEMPVLGQFDKAEWLKDGRPLPADNHLKPEQTDDGVQKLTFKGLKPEDTGDYTVRASNPAGTVESAPIKVNVLPDEEDHPKPQAAKRPKTDTPAAEQAPEILSAPKEVVSGPGSKPELEVLVKSNPEAQVEWLKDGRPLTQRQLSDGHLEPQVEHPNPQDEPDVVKHTLKVDKLRGTDEAEYKLVAKNPLGTAETEPISLKVDRTMGPREEPQVTPAETTEPGKAAPIAGLPKQAPEVVKLPEEVVAGVGSSPSLEAEIKANPKADVKWFKDGQPIEDRLVKSGHLEPVEEPTGEPGVTKHALKINDLKPTDVAAYHLVAENPLGEQESEPINLRIDRSMGPRDEPQVTPAKLPEAAAAQPEIVSAPKEVVAGPGSSPELAVEVKGEPTPEVQWLKDGEPLPARLLRDGHLEPTSEPTDVPGVTKQVLKVNDLKPSDAGDYTLKAENPAGTEESEPIKLKVDRSMGPRDEPKVEPADSQKPSESAPKIVEAPKEVVAGPGSSPELAVEVKGEPTPEVQWLKDGEPLPARLLRDGHLEPTSEPTDVPGVTKQVLKVNDLKPSDAGDYTLKAENPAGTEESEPIKLKVDRSMGPREEPQVTPAPTTKPSEGDKEKESVPEIVSAPKEVVAGPGSSPELAVEVKGEPTPEVQWLKDGEPLPARLLRDGHLEPISEPTDVPGVTKQILKVNDLKPSDAGDYTLKAENPAGTEESEPIKLNVDRSMGPKDEPKVSPAEELADEMAPKILEAAKEVAAGPGSSPVLVADVEASPDAKVEWLKDGEPLPARLLRDGHLEPEVEDVPQAEVPTKRHSLKINDLRPSDAGDYTLKAENPLGEQESEPIKLKVDRSMGPREEPQVTPADHDQRQPADHKDAAAPRIKSVPEEVVAGVGSKPQIVAEVEGNPEPKLKWFKDGQPLAEQPEFKSGHLEVVDLPSDKPDVKKQALQINGLKPADAAAYHVKAENPLGDDESEPTNLRIDRSMGPRDEPVITKDQEVPMEVDDAPAVGDKKPEKDEAPAKKPKTTPVTAEQAPEILSAPKEVVSGPGSKPELEVLVKSNPEAQVEWLKDGRPLTQRQLSDGHLEPQVEHPNPQDEPDVVKHTLKVDKLRGTDEAEYKLVAKNPLGTAETEPISLKVDRTMGPREEPQVTPAETREPEKAVPVSGLPKQAPEIVKLPEEVVAGVGSSPSLEAEIKANPKADVKWFKDGQPIEDRLVKSGHLEPVEEPTGVPGVTKHALKINDLKPTDVAAYHLVAENPLGEQESEPINLRIDRSMGSRDEPQVTSAKLPEAADAQPEIVSAPKEVVAGPGSSPELVVEVKGKPTPEVQWLKDGEPLPTRLLRDGHLEPTSEPTDVPGVTKQVLKVNDLKPSDAGDYTLKAENPAGTEESEPIKLKVDRSMGPRDEPKVESGESKPEIVSAPKEVVAGPGSSPELAVEIKGEPKPEVQWLKDGEPLPARLLRDGHLEPTSEPTDVPGVTKQVLRVNDLKPSDAGDYTLKAENPAGTEESEPIKLKVDRSMKPSDEPQEKSEAPQPQETAKSLVAPKIVSKPKEVVAGPGSSPELAVEVKGEPKPEVQWFKDGEPLPARLIRDGHLEPTSEPTDVPGVTKEVLRVNDMRPSDVAEYTVKATNPAGSDESAPIKLRQDRSMSRSDAPVVVGDDADKPTVDDQRAPAIVSVPDEIVAGAGSAPSIVAEASGVPRPEMSWFKDGQPLEEQPEFKSGHLEVVELPSDKPDVKKQALKINDLKPADAAAYHVKAENPLGEAESEPVNLRLDRSMGPQDEPQETTKRPKLSQAARSIKSPLGSSPVLTVELESGSGQPDKVEWLKDGRVVKESPDMHIEFEQLPDGTQRLQINNLRPEDEGVYRLRASNQAGVAESGPIALSAEVAPAAEAAREELKPEIVNMTELVTAGPGGQPELWVEVRAKPEASVTWFKDGRPLPGERRSSIAHVAQAAEQVAADVRRYQLRVDKMRPSDEATYHLVATNPLGSTESQPIQLRMDKLLEAEEAPLVKLAHDLGGSEDQFAPQILSHPEEVVAGLGSSPKLECVIKASPRPQTAWFKDGQPLEEQPEFKSGHVSIERTPIDADTIKEALVIHQMKPADVAAYHVRAANPLGECESEPTNVRFDRTMLPEDAPQVTLAETPFSPEEAERSRGPQKAPSIRRMPRKVVCALGSSPVIEVEVDGQPRPEVVWFKDGKQVSEMRGHLALVELPDGTHKLCLQNVKAVDQGDYTIRATNKLGECQSAPISLVIDASMSPRDEQRVVDSRAPLEADEAASEEAKLPSGAFAPKIVRHTDRLEAAMGDAGRLEVEVTAKPAATCQWFHDGEPLSSRSLDEGHVVVSEESCGDTDQVRCVLQVSELKPSDAGTYHLVAENPLGSARSPSSNVVLHTTGDEEDKPKKKMRAPVIKRVPRQVVAALGSSPVLEVEISGEPVPEVVWFRNGKRLERTDAHFTWDERPQEGIYRLQVNNARSADEATYTVVATNEAGSAESGPIELKVTTRRESRAHELVAGQAPEILEFPREISVDGLQRPLTMSVVVKAAPQAELTWFVDGRPLTLTTKDRVTKTQVDETTTKYELQIERVQEDTHLGAYHVRAENSAGVAESEPCQVSLATDQVEKKPDEPKRKLRAPVIRRLPRRIVAAPGSAPVIEIEITGEPKPEVVWFKNGRRVRESRGHIAFEELEGGIYRLCFTDLKTTDQAEYTVTATNEVGSVESSPITLVVDRTLHKTTEPVVQASQDVPLGDENGPMTAPVILGLDQDQEAQVGETVKLEAEVLGNPKPQIKWLKDGDEVELNILNEVPDSNLHSLTLKNVNDLYDGVYSLEASNPAGVARKDAKVRVVEADEAKKRPSNVASDQFKMEPKREEPKRKEPEEAHDKPFIKRGLKFSQVNQGRSIRFEVQIDGKYDELIWMKDGERINLTTEEETEEEVVTQETTLSSDQDYDSDATIQGDSRTEAKPKRRFAPRIVRRPRDIVAGPGSRIALEVRCEGEPKPEIVWYKNGQVVKATSDGKITIVEEDVDGQTSSMLIIEELETTDVGEYHVVVENPYGSERSLPARVELDETMVASDDLATTSDGRFLKKGRAPRILVRPRPLKAPLGSRIALECQVWGEPMPVVNWFRDGRLITQTSDGHVRIEEHSSGVCRLVIDNFTQSDVGQYHVVAENKLGSERTIPVVVELDEDAKEATYCSEEITEETREDLRRKLGRPPRILLRPKSLVVQPGDEIKLEVNVVGHSKPELIWYKDGKRITTSSRITIHEESTSTSGYQRLVIKDATAEDAGAYTVSAENDFGVAMSEPVSVTVSETTTTETTTTTTTTETFYERFVTQDESEEEDDGKKKRKPRFLVKPRNKKAPRGSKVEFECVVSGEPKPEIIWFKNGRRIHEQADGRVRVEEFSDGGGSRLILEDLEESDDALYQAEARNEWGRSRCEEVRLRVVEKREASERVEHSRTASGARRTTRTKKTRSHYTFSEEPYGWVTLTLEDAQLEHDGDYKLVVRNKWGEASTQAPLVVIPRVESRASHRTHPAASEADSEGRESSASGRARRTPLDELEDYGHELDRSVGVFGSESRYQSGEDTYLLQLRDTEFPLRLRKYLRFGARQSPSLRSNLMDAHWGAGARVTVRERRKFREVMDEEIDDERKGLDSRPTPMRLQKEVGTCGYAAAQLEHLRVEAAERALRRQSAEPEAASGGRPEEAVEMMPPFFRVKLKDCVIEESGAGEQVAVFACLAAGQPAPEYSWFRNDIIITGTEQRMELVEREDGGSELRLRDPRLHDSGCFKCVARNPHGNVTCRARLRVATKPSRPEPPEFRSVTARAIFLEWRPPRDYDVNAAEVLGYRLEMSQSELGGQDEWRVVAPDVGHEYYAVDDLQPATSYSFRLSARNKFGWSDSSYSTYVTTCRLDGSQPDRLAIPHAFHQRQFVADIVDAHLLRHCEEPLRPELNYQLEFQPVQLEKHRGWQEDWRLQSEIARGRFSLISKAASKDGQQQVVVKAVLASAAASAQTKAEFDILRSLQHEKVATLKAAYRDDELFVFILERLSGIDVLTYLSSFTSYNEDQVSRIITQVMDALEYLHFRGMCLLELLPDNVVMVDGRSTSLKLVDFSSARFVPRSGARVPINSSQLVEFSPPEVMANHEVSTASDVWCLGTLAYLLLSGHSPFRGETEEETRENVRLGRYKYDHIYANCTPEVTRFLINVFKKHSASRPTIEQLYENKWLLPNEFMIRKRQHAVFKTDKIVAFAEEFHRLRKEAPEACAQQVADALQAQAGH